MIIPAQGLRIVLAGVLLTSGAGTTRWPVLCKTRLGSIRIRA
ncbi:hypothetical protein ACVME8_000330 [Bradyrhizobium diazoefficiens]